MITKAVIPVAGLGTRMLPMSAVVPKCLLPLTDSAGRCRAALHWLCAAARDAGVMEAAVVVSPSQHEMIARYVQASCGEGGYGAADPPLPTLHFVIQDRPAGFGDAVLRAEPFVGRSPFLLLLGDHVSVSPPGVASCVSQVARAFAMHRPAAMIGMQPVGEAQLCRVGVASGVAVASPRDAGILPALRDEGGLASSTGQANGTHNAGETPASRGAVFRATAFIEKPTPAQARERLVTPGLPEGQFLAHAGIYAFTSEIFTSLARVMPDKHGEIPFAAAQQLFLERHPKDYLLCQIIGQAHDLGHPAGYAAAQADFAAGISVPMAQANHLFEGNKPIANSQ
ncbi:MAG: sugar phosphate nucleotidyltransferase [Phycisphaerae bacterium]|nr:sugar phosphate nucleotidyltransferase [Phycisphaerae bacterium]